MIKIELIPAFNDNYIFLLIESSGKVAVVDPGDAAPVIKRLTELNLQLDYILNTHHHADHIGGNAELKAKYSCKVIAPEADRHRIKTIDTGVKEGNTFQLGNSTAAIIETYGHTIGHICYHFEDDQALFCGDTLFSMGCGRLFEGTPKQMHNSLNKIASLPDDTKIYCAHEYTQSNGEFCLTIEPENQALMTRMEQVKTLRAQNIPTIPVSIATEKQTNCFIRAKDADEFTRIRAMKDSF